MIQPVGTSSLEGQLIPENGSNNKKAQSPLFLSHVRGTFNSNWFDLKVLGTECSAKEMNTFAWLCHTVSF